LIDDGQISQTQWAKKTRHFSHSLAKSGEICRSDQKSSVLLESTQTVQCFKNALFIPDFLNCLFIDDLLAGTLVRQLELQIASAAEICP